MSFMDILWTIVTVFLLVLLFVALGSFIIGITYMQVTEGSVSHEDAQR